MEISDMKSMTVSNNSAFNLSTNNPKCYAEILPGVRYNLVTWPNWWVRIWHWFFFGVVWHPYKSVMGGQG